MKKLKVHYRQWRPKSYNGRQRVIRLYNVWGGVLSRCRGTWAKKYYFDKGISVCDEWLDFDIFRQWAIENGYRKGLTIDRIDNDGNYCPENCRWVTQAEQNRNKATTKGTCHQGENNPRTTLTEQDVIAIHGFNRIGMDHKSIAQFFGLTGSTIYQITTGRSWSHIKC